MSKLQRICIHWTAGGATANQAELLAYHFIVEASGAVIAGHYRPEANIAPLNGLRYAMHCGDGNSNTIGVAMAGRGELPRNLAPKALRPHLITRKTAEATYKLVAELCKRYSIPITAETVYTHYEFGQRNPRSRSAGKPDISVLPKEVEPLPIRKEEIGDYIRGKVRWYFEQLPK